MRKETFGHGTDNDKLFELMREGKPLNLSQWALLCSLVEKWMFIRSDIDPEEYNRRGFVFDEEGNTFLVRDYDDERYFGYQLYTDKDIENRISSLKQEIEELTEINYKVIFQLHRRGR